MSVREATNRSGRTTFMKSDQEYSVHVLMHKQQCARAATRAASDDLKPTESGKRASKKCIAAAIHPGHAPC